MAYSPTSGLVRDDVRARVGDTGGYPEGVGLLDEEYDRLLVLYPPNEAAARAAERLALQFSLLPRSFTDNELFESYDDRAKGLRELAVQIRAQGVAPAIDPVTGRVSGVRQMRTPDLTDYSNHTGLPGPFYPGYNYPFRRVRIGN